MMPFVYWAIYFPSHSPVGEGYDIAITLMIGIVSFFLYVPNFFFIELGVYDFSRKQFLNKLLGQMIIPNKNPHFKQS